MQVYKQIVAKFLSGIQGRRKWTHMNSAPNQVILISQEREGVKWTDVNKIKMIYEYIYIFPTGQLNRFGGNKGGFV